MSAFTLITTSRGGQVTLCRRHGAVLGALCLFTALVVAPGTAIASDDPERTPVGNGARNRLPSQSSPSPASLPSGQEAADAKAAIPDAGGFLPAAAGHGIKNRYIVGLKQTRTLASVGTSAIADQLIATYRGQKRHVYRTVLDGFELEATEANARRLAQDPAVQFVQQEQVATTAEDPTQENPKNWGLDRLDQRNRPLSRSFTYGYSTRGTSGTVYVLDTGIKAAHNEFKDGLGESRVRFGTVTIVDAGGKEDCDGHGTHVAGIVGGTKSGVSKGTDLVAVKVLNCNGVGTTSSIVRGIEWVTEDVKSKKIPLPIANMSLSMPGDLAVDRAVEKSIEAGIAYVVAAGNKDMNACDYTPARTNGTITVGATTNVDGRRSLSNWGECVNIFAPGSDISSADYTSPDKFTSKSGTSQAAPFVVGGILNSFSGDGNTVDEFTPAKARDKLIANSTKDIVTDTKGSPNRLLYTGRNTRSSCLPNPYRVTTPAYKFTALTERFYNYAQQNAGWTGADGTYSITDVAGKNRLWIFSDTFLPPVNTDDTRPTSAPLINNSILEDVSIGHFITRHGGTRDAPAAIMSGPLKDTWYWSGAPNRAILSDGPQLQVVYHQYRKFGPKLWDFRWENSVLATFDDDDLGHPKYVTPLPSSRKIAWGAAIRPLKRPEIYTYIYGVEDEHVGPPDDPTAVNKYLHIARVLGSDLSAGEGFWQFLDGHGDWMRQEAFSAREKIAGTNTYLRVSNEFSVDHDSRLVTQDTSQAFSGEIYLYGACDPSGPFGLKTFLYKTTEGGPWGDYGNKNLYTYNAKAHDYGSDPSLLTISYNVNSLDTDDVYRNIRWYQPRFIQVGVVSGGG